MNLKLYLYREDFYMKELNLVGSVEEMSEQISQFVDSFEKEAKKTVMWFSRHDMDTAQLQDLKRIYGEDLELIKVNGTIPNASILEDVIDLCDVIALVAPIDLQQQFFAVAGEEKDVITSKSKRVLIKGQDGEDKVQFIFANWFQIEKMEIVMKKL